MHPKRSNSSLWPETILEEVLEAGNAVGKETKPLGELWQKYQTPLRVHLLHHFRSFPRIINNADDLLHDFFVKKIMRDGWLNLAKLKRGPFRNQLKMGLENIVWDWWEKQPEYKMWLEEKKKKDKGKRPDTEAEIVPVLPPDAEPDPFPVAWIQTLLAETLKGMENDCKCAAKEQPKRSYIWEVFRLRLLEPILEDTEAPPYEKLVRKFDLKSVSEATNMLLTAKRIFERHLNDAIAEYEGNAAKTELEDLKRSLSRIIKGKSTSSRARSRRKRRM